MSWKRAIGLLIFAWILVCSSSFQSAAATPKSKLTVVVEDKNKQPIEQLQVSVYKIAEIRNTDYYPAPGFENSGISIAGLANQPSAENAKTVWEYIKAHQIGGTKQSSQNGKVVFKDLDAAIWLVVCDDGQAHHFNPFFVFLPQVSNGTLKYDVTSTPKTESNTSNSKTIYVVVKWEDSNDALKWRPKKVLVSLKRNGQIVDSEVLSPLNAWAHTFQNLSTDGQYSVEEESVEYYDTTYNGDAENGFVITNLCKATNKRPNTGDYMQATLWGALLIVSGLCFFIIRLIQNKGRK